MDEWTLKQKKSYERAAVKHENNEVMRFKWYGSDLKKMEEFDFQIIHLIPRHAKILEVGCGSGRLAKKIWTEREDVNYTGIDIVTDNIRVCKRLKLTGFEFKTENYWNALIAGDFDFVISEGVLFSTTDKKYQEALFNLLNSKAVRGFFVMAIVTPYLGIEKELMERLMEEAERNSVYVEGCYYKPAADEVMKAPANGNKVFYIVRESVRVKEFTLPPEVLNEQ